jgi:hypothetical protein
VLGVCVYLAVPALGQKADNYLSCLLDTPSRGPFKPVESTAIFSPVRELSVFFKGDGQWKKRRSVLGAAMFAVTNAFRIGGQA